MKRLFLYSLSSCLLLMAIIRSLGFSIDPARQFDHLLQTAAAPANLDPSSNWQLRKTGESAAADSNAITDEQDFPNPRQIPATDERGRPNYVPGQIIVRFRDGVARKNRDKLISRAGTKILKTINARDNTFVLQVPANLSVPDAAEQFAALPEVAYAEPDILHYIDVTPNDSLYTAFNGKPSELQRWYFNGIDNDPNLNAEAAWNLTTGSPHVIIAVIDTGIALNHPDLIANIWQNSGEIPGNGIDDDSNGFTDDIAGWDFYDDDNDPNPDLGDGYGGDRNVYHGTFVAGCAAATGDNSLGVVGASWRSRLMALKVFTNDGGAPSSAIAAAILYATDNGAQIINMSFGSAVPSKAIAVAAKIAWARGTLMVAAAGNANAPRQQFPAGFKHVISVGGSGRADKMRSRAGFSQFGKKAVDVVAPAVDIVSTAVASVYDQSHGGEAAGTATYYYGDGTSFAAPLVAGEAALLMARAEELGLEACLGVDDYRQVILTATRDLPDDPADNPDAGPDWDGRGRVDFHAAVQTIGPALVTAPRPPRKVVAQPASANRVDIRWMDGSSNEQGFRIERADRTERGPMNFEILADVGPGVTVYSDVSVEPGREYAYRVCAYNVAAQSFARNIATVVTPR